MARKSRSQAIERPAPSAHPKLELRPTLAAQPPRIDGVSIGTIHGVERGGEGLLVEFPENRSGSPVPARSLAPFTAADSGARVALLFEAADPTRPIVLGRLTDAARAEARLDGKRIELSAEDEIVLRCGAASITLTRAGKVLIRGAYVLSGSSGVNRIRGGSVQIN